MRMAIAVSSLPGMTQNNQRQMTVSPRHSLLFQYATHFCCVACASAILFATPANAFEMELGAVMVRDTFTTPAWTNVAFAQPFATTPIVAAMPTNEGGDPSTIRIRNVTNTGFQILQVEPSANDGPHLAMSTAYVAVEPGNHILPDGSRLVAMQHSTVSFANRLLSTSWDTIAFPGVFTGNPTVVAQIQTMSNESGNPPSTGSIPFVDTGIRNVTASTMQVTLERAESPAGAILSSERMGIIAVQSNVNILFVDVLGSTVRIQSVLTPVNIAGWDNGCCTNNYAVAYGGTPLTVASANSRNGNNGGWVRRCSQSSTGLGLTIDEDTDTDSERNHTTESAGIISASQAFHVNFGVDLLVSKVSSVVADPYNGSTNPKAIPNADVEYTIGVVNRGSGSADTDSLTVTEGIDPGLRLCVSTLCQAGGPILFDDSASPVPPGINLGSVQYSDNGGATYTYVPSPDADGFDSAVNALQITMTGSLVGVAPAGAPSFELIMAARVN